jgi:ankyrin repeat protein
MKSSDINPYAKLKPIDKHAGKRVALDIDMKLLLQQVDEIKATSATFKNIAYVEKYRSQKLLPTKCYARAISDLDNVYEFTPFTWPTLLFACQTGDEFNVRAIIKNRAFDPRDADELARCIDAASKRGDESIARLLIFSGADPKRYFPDNPRKAFNPLCTAAAAGQTHLVVALLDLGADADAHPPALHVACSQGSLESVKAIVRWMEKDAADDKWMKLKDDCGQTCVHRAAKNGHINILIFLCVHRSANINAVDNKKQTPLMLAVLLGSLSTVQWMIKNGALLSSVCDHRGDNALLMSFFACTRRPKRGRLLTSRFQNEIQQPNGEHYKNGLKNDSHFQGIEEQRRIEENRECMNIVKYLVSLVSKEEQLVRNALGESMLIMACKYSMESLVQIVLNLDSSQPEKDNMESGGSGGSCGGKLLHLKTKRNENALHFACRSQSVRIIYLLRCMPIDEELVSNDGLQPMDIATSTGNIDVMDAMLSPSPLKPSPVGAKRAQRWEQGGRSNVYKGLHRLTHDISKDRMRVALCAAARFGHPQCIERLVGYFRCSIQVTDSKGNTPLHLSVENNKFHAAKILKAYGVSLQAKNNRGETVYDIVKRKINADVTSDGQCKWSKMMSMLKMPFV